MKRGKKLDLDDEASFLFEGGGKHKVFADEESEENDADLSSDIKSMLKSFASEYGAELIHDKEIGEEVKQEKREQRKENKKRFADLKSKRATSIPKDLNSNRVTSSKTEATLYEKFQAWFSAVPYKADEEDKKKFTLAEVEKLKAKANTLYDSLKTQFEQLRENSQTVDDKWLGTVMKSGTTSDKLAAITLSVQENPYFRIDKLNHIINMIKKKPSLAIMALNTSVDLWSNNILPDRKLIYFADRPLHDRKLLTDTNLIDWIFEEKLKDIYLEYVQELQKSSQSTLEALRSKSTKHIFTLLAAKPEQEKLLLSALVNKLGDPSKQVGSSSGYFLEKLVKIHPNMRSHIIKEVELIVFRPSVGFHALQYGLAFLSQIMLSKEDNEIANRLIDLYFNVFKTLNSKKEVHSKILDLILTGIHRAFPFSEFDEKKYSTHIDDLFKIVHISSISKSIQALQVLYHIISSRYVLADRYYRSLYQLLLSPDLRLSSKQMIFLNLLYKSIKIDSSIERIASFLKRLLQVCLYSEPGFATGAIYLLSQILSDRPETRVLIDEYSQQQIEDKKDTKPVKKEGEADTSAHSNVYDPLKREPLYSNASKSCCWELVALSSHYHPSVRVCVERLMNGEKIPMESDPIQDHSVSNFLDKFTLKNPKISNKKHTISPLASKSVKPTLIKPAELVKKREQDVPEDQMFFYKFFQGKVKEQQRARAIVDAGKRVIENQLEKYHKTEYDYSDLADEDFYDDDNEMFYEQDQDVIEDQLEYDEENMEGMSAMGGLGEEEDEDEENEQEEGTQSSVFAAAEEFQDLLDEVETSGQVRQRGWEDRASSSSSGNKRKGNNFKRKFKKSKQ